MTPAPIDLDGLLVGLSPAVKEAVQKRLSLMPDIKALKDLIAAAELDEELAPLVMTAQGRGEEGRRAFDLIWPRISHPIRNVIGVHIRCRNADHVGEVESFAAEAIWNNLKGYQRSGGFFLTWARAYAANQARWHRCRPLGGYIEDLDDPAGQPSIELPPSACYSEMLDMVQHREPWEAAAFLLNKYLDWKPAAIAEKYGDTPLPNVVEAIQTEMVACDPILAGAKASLIRLYRKTRQAPEKTFRDYLKGDDQLVDSITRWSGEVKRAVGNGIISQAKSFFAMACGLAVGAHERLAFLWCRLLREPATRLCALAAMLLLDLLDLFRDGYMGMNDLTEPEIANCLRPLRATMEKARNMRLEDCSKEDLCADVVAWRDRVQTILLGMARDRNLLAYCYLCGCVPGVNGPAKKGV